MELVKTNSMKNAILALCKDNARKEDKDLVFVDLGRDMFKNNELILNKYFKNENGQDCYYANLLALRPLKVNLYEIKKILKKDFGKNVSLKGYKHDPEHYKFSTQAMQDEYEEDLFKDKSNEEEDAECEAIRRNRIEPLDFSLVESLYRFIYKAIKNRYVMLFNVEDVPGILNNAIECYNLGVSCGPSNEAMAAKIAHIRKLLEDAEVIEWLKTGPTDMSFDPADYVQTYQKVIRQLTGIRDESLENTCFDIMHREDDLWEDMILTGTLPEFLEYHDDVKEIEEEDY